MLNPSLTAFMWNENVTWKQSDFEEIFHQKICISPIMILIKTKSGRKMRIFYKILIINEQSYWDMKLGRELVRLHFPFNEEEKYKINFPSKIVNYSANLDMPLGVIIIIFIWYHISLGLSPRYIIQQWGFLWISTILYWKK